MITVKELIEKLSTMPPEMKVFRRGKYLNGGPEAKEITSVEIWNSALTPNHKRHIVYAGTGTYPNTVQEYLEHNPDHNISEDIVVIED